MEFWWVSPALVGVGVSISIILGLRRDAKHEGVVDTILVAHEKRLTAHGQEIDSLKDRIGRQGEQITAIDVRCETVRCDTLHAKVIDHD
jgi:hypothetical protein